MLVKIPKVKRLFEIFGFNQLTGQFHRIMLQVFKERTLPWCKNNGLELLIMDNDPKLHSKMVVRFMKKKECKYILVVVRIRG